jgi:chromosome segregation ATPase
LQATRAALEGDLNYFRGESTRLATRLGGEETRAGELQERCARLEAQVTSQEAEVTSLEAQVTSLEAEVTSLTEAAEARLAEMGQMREAGEAKEAALERIRDVAIRQNQHVLMNCQIHRQCWIRDVYPGSEFYASPIPDPGSKRFRISDP